MKAQTYCMQGRENAIKIELTEYGSVKWSYDNIETKHFMEFTNENIPNVGGISNFYEIVCKAHENGCRHKMYYYLVNNLTVDIRYVGDLNFHFSVKLPTVTNIPSKMKYPFTFVYGEELEILMGHIIGNDILRKMNRINGGRYVCNSDEDLQLHLNVFQKANKKFTFDNLKKHFYVSDSQLAFLPGFFESTKRVVYNYLRAELEKIAIDKIF